MLATRWAPRSVWSEMNRLREEMDHLFGRYAAPRSGTSVYPPLNLWENDNQFFVEAELPGFDMNDLEITVTGHNQLSLKGERKQPEVTGGTWHRQERGYGTFSRMIELPEHVDGDHVSAKYEHGVLTVMLPKREEAKPRRIEVKAG